MLQLLRYLANNIHSIYFQPGDVADGAGIEGAVALDGRVDIGVDVHSGVVDGGAAAGLAADVPIRRRDQAPSPQDRVERSHFDWISSWCLLSLSSCNP